MSTLSRGRERFELRAARGAANLELFEFLSGNIGNDLGAKDYLLGLRARQRFQR